jgi:hypothetical protein
MNCIVEDHPGPTILGRDWRFSRGTEITEGLGPFTTRETR